MIKSNVTVALIIVFLLVTNIIIGSAYPQDVWAAEQSQVAAGAGGAATGESLGELKEKLWKATD